MARIHGALKCRDARYLTKTAASYYEAHARLGRNPLAKISHCTYRPTRSGVIHAICEIYDNADLVRFSIREITS